MNKVQRMTYEGHWGLNKLPNFRTSTVPDVLFSTEHSTNGARCQQNASSCSGITEFGMSPEN